MVDESEGAAAARHIDTQLVPQIKLLENVADAAVWYFRTARLLQVPGTDADARRILNEMNDALALLVVTLQKAGYNI